MASAAAGIAASISLYSAKISSTDMAENSTSSSIISLRRREGEGSLARETDGSGCVAPAFSRFGRAVSPDRGRREKPESGLPAGEASGEDDTGAGTERSAFAVGRGFRLRRSRRSVRADGASFARSDAFPAEEPLSRLFCAFREEEAGLAAAAEGAAPVGGREASSLIRAASRRERGASVQGTGGSSASVYSAQNSDRMSDTDMFKAAVSTVGSGVAAGRGAGAAGEKVSSGKIRRTGASTCSGSFTGEGTDCGALAGAGFFPPRPLRRSFPLFLFPPEDFFSEKMGRTGSAGAGSS